MTIQLCDFSANSMKCIMTYYMITLQIFISLCDFYSTFDLKSGINYIVNVLDRTIFNVFDRSVLSSSFFFYAFPTQLLAANKFIFANGGDSIVNQQTQSIKMILGDRNLLELSGKDHSRVRGALVSFLKPESLKQYVGKIDEEVRSHIQEVGLVNLLESLPAAIS
ncbi:beta-amyrin 28-monooxygenase [Trifolium repens]|nr:beta-amyrin 28-monooxygenase [Trifolium repens]